MADSAQKDKITQKFKSLDKDNSGFLNRDEVKKGLKEIYAEIDLKLTDVDIDQMIKRADKNNDGKIQINEFVEMI